MTEDYRAGNSSVQLEKITLDIDIEFIKGTTFGNATSEKHKRCFVGAIVVLDTAPTANWTDLSARQYFNTLYFDSYNFTTRPIRDYWQTKSGGRFHVLAEKQEMIGAPELGYPQVLHWSFDRRLHNTEIEWNEENKPNKRIFVITYMTTGDMRAYPADDFKLHQSIRSVVWFKTDATVPEPLYISSLATSMYETL